jgi:hypothetical protein
MKPAHGWGTMGRLACQPGLYRLRRGGGCVPGVALGLVVDATATTLDVEVAGHRALAHGLVDHEVEQLLVADIKLLGLGDALGDERTGDRVAVLAQLAKDAGHGTGKLRGNGAGRLLGILLRHCFILL